MALLEDIQRLINRVKNSKGEKMSTKERILNILNEKEIEEDVKKEIENELEEIEKEEKEEKEEVDNKCKNEKVDKRKLIDEVGGILKGKVDDEIIRTVIGKIEKAAYDESEAGTDDNKKVKNEETEEDKEKVKEVKKDVKEDVENKCKNTANNAVDYFNKMNEVYNASCKAGVQQKYETQSDRLKAGNKY